MDGRPAWTDCDEAGYYAVPNVLSPRDLVSRPDIMDETVPHRSFTEKPRYIRQVDAAMLCLWLVEALRYKTKKLSVKRIPLYSLLLL